MEQLIEWIWNAESREFFAMLFGRFFVNILFVSLVIDKIYYRNYRQKEYLFTFWITNILIFFVTSMLVSVKVKTGFAFGMFAVLSILRFRTEQLQVKEMTFLFMAIIIAVINSLVTVSVPIIALMLANVTIVSAAFFLEKAWIKTPLKRLTVQFEEIELINVEERERLIEVLKKRTGLSIVGVEIERINYLQDSAELTIIYE